MFRLMKGIEMRIFCAPAVLLLGSPTHTIANAVATSHYMCIIV